jgi:uncharacterized protein
MNKTERILEAFLSSPKIAGSMGSLIETDGYLTALIIGPNLIMPSEWMANLWAGRPAFDDTEEARMVTGTLMDHYNGIIRQLDGPPESYRPLYLPEDSSQPATIEHAAEWSQGFWRPLIEDKDARHLLVPILAFAKTPEGTALFNHTPDNLEDIFKGSVDDIAEIILLIREYWREQAASRDSPIRSFRTGRNDLCPCGSGKKYKRCCGIN